MSRLRQRLTEQYARHYLRLNTASEGPRLPRPQYRFFDRTFAHVVRALPPASRVLDLGCGTGQLLQWLAHQSNLVPIGVDTSSAQVSIARAKLAGIEIHAADGLGFLRERAGAFHAIFCVDVLEHIPGDDVLLELIEFAVEALKPGGAFVCRTPNAANLFACYSRYMDLTHERCFTSSSIIQLLESAGLERCRVFPTRPGTFRGQLALSIERILHRVLFALTGRSGETGFSMNLNALGYKKSDDR
ncbi:MAG: methyltransferase domain-containing protein [Candidatus Rokubacteria bacterium]|nr:methyltransferase domain-containing protein [Candidatus Rokubacteria bacterium]